MKRILFVDDESKVLDGIRRMLHAERKNLDMQFALGSEAALQACEESTFDVVVSDMCMPGMDGAALLNHIRDRYPSTARILLSGYTDIAGTMRAIPAAHRFLAKPCNSFELLSTIERVSSLQDILSTPEIRNVIGTVGELPSLSDTYTHMLQAVRDPNSSINDVAEIIAKDVAMSAKVLQLANSAFFGVSQEVTSLHNAATYLGVEALKNLAFVTEAFRIFVPGKRISQSLYESLQNHAQQTASIAGTFPVEPNTREVIVVAALLHDIGKLFLAHAMPDAFCSVLSLSRERPCKIFEAEEELLGTSHAEIGAYLLGLWGLPHMVVEAIACHHRPTRLPHSVFDSSTAVYVANLLAHDLEVHPGASPQPELAESDRSCLEMLGILPKYAEFRELARQRSS